MFSKWLSAPICKLVTQFKTYELNVKIFIFTTVSISITYVLVISQEEEKSRVSHTVGFMKTNEKNLKNMAAIDS